MIEDQNVASVQDLSAVNRKRPSETYHGPENQPPSKKGQFNKDVYNCTSMKTLEEKVEEIRRELSNKELALITLKAKVQSLDSLLDLTKEDLQSERISKERLSNEVEVLKLELASSGQRIFKLTEDVMIQKSNFESLISEISFQKETNEQQSEKAKLFQLELEFVRQDRADKELQIKMLEENLVKLSGFQTEAQECMVDLKNTKSALEEVKEESVKKTIKIESLQRQLSDLDQELHQAQAKAVRQDTTHFHKIIESMQKECEQIATLSSKKTQQNEELKQQIELLNNAKADLQNECTELKQNEATIQTSLEEKSDLFQQLKAKLEETECKLNIAVQASVQDKENHSELQKQMKNHKSKIKAKDLEISKCQTNITRLEEQLKERESLITDLQNNLKGVEEKFQESERCVGNFEARETKLRAEVQEIQDDLTVINDMLSKKTGELENKLLEIVQLKKDLSDNSSKSQILADELQRKDEEYSDLKEKYMDAKKQIQQVEKEISTKREEEKCVRHKLQELERMKNQMAQDLEAKERIIQQFKRACSSETDLQKKVALLTITLEQKNATLIKLEKDLEEYGTTNSVKEQQFTEAKEGQKLNKDSSHYPNQKPDIVLTDKTEESVHFQQTTSKELEKQRLRINDLTEKCNKIEHHHLTQNKNEEYSREVESFQNEIEVLKNI
uniref:Uncharacterized protein n=1 Tax=Callorhinchus milii TaxID=7868 RepID=A0A4W3JQN9_CALMI